MNKRITIRHIAGYCVESALWKIILDLSWELQNNKMKLWKVLTPDTVIVDGKKFYIIDAEENPEMEFCPPEGTDNLAEAGVVWSLGALVCYASSGHYIFGGRGGIYQHANPNIELPVLRKEHSDLTPIIQRCLCYSPSQRINLKNLHNLAFLGLESCKKKERVRIINKVVNATYSISDDVWPEEMC